MKADLKAMNNRRNNAKECINDLGEEQKSPSQNSRKKVK